jgi:hypothetical protein
MTLRPMASPAAAGRGAGRPLGPSARAVDRLWRLDDKHGSAGHADAADGPAVGRLGFGRIVVSDLEVPNTCMLANLV